MRCAASGIGSGSINPASSPPHTTATMTSVSNGAVTAVPSVKKTQTLAAMPHV